jgi:hypothetical protein
MSEPPDDAARVAWSKTADEGRDIDLASARALLRRREAAIRRRDRSIYVSAAIIVPSWAAAMWFLPDLRVMAALGLALAVWIVWQVSRRSAARLDRGAVDLPCVAFQQELLKREIALRRDMPKWYLIPVVAGQVVIVGTLFSNPRFAGSRFFALGIMMFLGSVIVVLVTAWQRWRSEVAELESELATLNEGTRS